MSDDHLAIFDVISRANVPRGDFHIHTTWTDGKHGVREMYDAAVAADLQTALFSEHARKSSGDWFPKFADEVRSLPQDRCKALVGVETKVDDLSGAVDCTEEILRNCDLVMASVHRFPGEVGNVWKVRNHAPEEALQIELSLACAVLDNPAVDILGHAFGMSYRRFGTAPPEHMMRAVIDKAARTRVAIEINPHYHPDPWRLVAWCQEAGARISLGSNAHACGQVGRVTRVLEGREAASALSA